MGLFKKGKKDKDKDKDKEKKKVQDRFMRRALQASFPNAKSNDMLEFEFTEAFSEDKLATIGRVTDRMLLGRGEFDKLYQLSKVIARKYTPYISGDDDPSDELVKEMIEEFTKLEGLADTWLQSSEAKWSNKDEAKKDKTTQIKEIEARGMLKGARTALFQLRHRTELEDPATTKMVAELEAVRDRLKSATATAADVEAYRSADVKVLAAVCGTSTPSSGTSDVKLIKGPDGDVAYAFKSVEGESDMMGTPKGFATAREVMMSKLCEGLKANHGLEFGWPKATMASVGGKPGALIDGVQGTKIGPELSMEDLPAEALQKILLCNLAGGQFDIKSEDVRFVRKGETLEPTCMDGGAAMPDADTATNFLAGLSDGKPGLPIIYSGGPENDGYRPEATKPISKELVKQFLSINTKQLKAEMEATAKQLEKDHKLSVKDLGLDSGITTAMTSIEGIQKILNDAGGDITLVDFLTQYHDQVIQKKFVEPKLAQWTKTQLAEYQKLVVTHGPLFAPATQDTKIDDLFRNVLHPEMRANLKKLTALAKPRSIADMLKAYGMKVPISSPGTKLLKDVENVQKAISSDLKEYDKVMQKYPGVIAPKDTFAGPEQAYAAVLERSQEYALGELKTIAETLSKTEGKTVTIGDLLQRYGYKVPTSNFKEKSTAIKAKLQPQEKTTGTQ
jgi:hypothetical protein